MPVDGTDIRTDPASRLAGAERIVVLTAIGFVLVMVAVGAFAGGEAMLESLSHLTPGLLLGLLGLSLANYLLRAIRWQLFSRAIGVVVPTHAALAYFIAGFSMTTTPGKVGEALRLWFIKRGHGYAYDRSAVLLVADRLSDAGSMVLLVLLSVAAFASHVGVSLVAAAAMALVTGIFLRPVLLIRTVDVVYARVRRGRRIFGRIRRAARQMEHLASMRVYGTSLTLGLFGWLAEAWAFHWLLTALGADVSLPQAVFIFAFSMVVGGISILPGGLGGAEATMVGLLVALAVPLEVAIAATAIIRITTLWFAVALGFAGLPFAMKASNPRPMAIA